MVDGKCHVVRVPQVLGDRCQPVELFYKAVASVPSAPAYALDLQFVNFVQPYGVLALVNAARLLNGKSKQSVELINIRPSVHSYLERVDLFELNEDVFYCSTRPAHLWARSDTTITVLELTVLNDEKGLDALSRSARRIFTPCIGAAAGLIVTTLNELCMNVLLHSRDHSGTVLIQRCRAIDDARVTCIRVAVSDLGIGIQNKLAQTYPQFDKPAKALGAVLHGYTSRGPDARSALGLRSVAIGAAERKGYFWLRSGTAALLHDAQGSRLQHNLYSTPGTQIGLEFRVKLAQPPEVLDDLEELV